MKGGTKMGMFELRFKSGEVVYGFRDGANGVIGENGEELGEIGRQLTPQDVVSQLRQSRELAERNSERCVTLARRLYLLQDALTAAVREGEVESDAAREIAAAGGLTIKMRKRVVGKHSWVVDVEWDIDEEEPDADEIAGMIELVGNGDFQIDNYDVDSCYDDDAR